MAVRAQYVANTALSDEKAENTSRELLLAFAPLKSVALGVACAVVCGALLSVATLYLLIRGASLLDFNLLGQFFWGYRVSVPGFFVGFLWGAAFGFVFGYAFAVIRNAAIWFWLTAIRSRAEMEQYSDFLDHL